MNEFCATNTHFQRDRQNTFLTCAVSHCLKAACLLTDAKKGVKKCKGKKGHKAGISDCPVFTCLPSQKPKIKSLLWTGLIKIRFSNNKWWLPWELQQQPAELTSTLINKGLILVRYKEKTHKITSPVAHTKQPQTHFNCWQQLPFLWRDCKPPERGVSAWHTNRGWVQRPQEDRGDKGDGPSEMLGEKGFVGKQGIQAGDGIFLHQFQSFLIPFLNLLTISQFNAILLSSIFFSSAPNFFLFFLLHILKFLCFAFSTYTAYPFSSLSDFLVMCPMLSYPGNRDLDT